MMRLFKKKPDVVAAVDLGSNSFHLLIARIRHDQLHVIDAIKETVRLGSGVTPEHGIDPATGERALACLQRFGQRLGDMHPDYVRAVGTNALRRAFRSADFLDAAEAAIGYPIEVISGMEEARLIYTGVSHCHPGAGVNTLVVDIGGGSTEVVVGRGYQPTVLESLHMGCLGLSRRCFGDGVLDRKRFDTAILIARQELEPVAAVFRQCGWDQAIGSSGTVRCIADNIQALQMTNGDITLEALHQLRQQLTDAGLIEKVDLPHLPQERRAVLPGGLSVLIAAFEALQIRTMQASDCALREGILYELLGSGTEQDTRLKTVSNLCKRYQIDMQHASRVEHTAMRLYRQVAERWDLDDPRLASNLRHAAQLHEIGLAISHSRYQLHGAYLIEHSDLHGFNRQEQIEIATLIRLHRRKLRSAYPEGLKAKRRKQLTRLAMVLRLAVLLHRSRTESQPAPEVTLTPGEQTLDVLFPDGWLGAHPLTEADLAQEAQYQRSAGYRLNIT